jgi:hypothetical protein
MTRAAFLTVAAVISALFGLSFLLLPVPLLAVYGIDLEPNGAWLGRYLGADYLGLALMLWLARRAPQGGASDAILAGLFALTALGFVIALLHALSGLANALAWSTVLLFLLLALGAGYFRFVKPSAA